ncbi:MAG: transporter substrate-binding domain-containing protein [Desulfobacteraceae bacterium]|jgi:polar amino acid transport system substrate-binding protein
MKKLWIVLTILAMASPVFADDVMKFAFGSDAAPFAWEEDGQVYGLLPDIAREVIEKRHGIKVSFHLHPWKRAQHLVRQEILDAHITNGPLRKEWAEHGQEVVLMLRVKPFVKKGGPKFEELKKIKRLEDLRPYNLVQHRGSRWDQKNLVDKKFKVHLVADYDTMFKLLDKGRADVVVFEAYMARHVIKNLGLSDQIVELDVSFTGEGFPFHLVVGKKSTYTKVIPLFDDTLRQMKQDGSFQTILDKYR